MYSDCNSSAKSRDFFLIGIMLKTKGSVNTQEFDCYVFLISTSKSSHSPCLSLCLLFCFVPRKKTFSKFTKIS